MMVIFMCQVDWVMRCLGGICLNLILSVSLSMLLDVINIALFNVGWIHPISWGLPQKVENCTLFLSLLPLLSPSFPFPDCLLVVTLVFSWASRLRLKLYHQLSWVFRLLTVILRLLSLQNWMRQSLIIKLICTYVYILLVLFLWRAQNNTIPCLHESSIYHQFCYMSPSIDSLWFTLDKEKMLW